MLTLLLIPLGKINVEMMKRLFIAMASIAILSFTTWQPDFETATKLAKEKHQLILLNFSGSDWCIPCIRMRKNIFDNDSFSAITNNRIVMVNADFPRNKKNQPAASLKKQNEALADKYNSGGKFPYTVLLDADGKVLKSWEGLPKKSAEEFALEVKQVCDAHQ